MRLNKSVLAFASVLTLASLAKEPCPPRYSGLYNNAEYGYSLRIPAGLFAEHNSPCQYDDHKECVCLGNHGVIIALESNAFISAFASYSVLEHPALGDALRFYLSTLGEGCDDVTVSIEELKEATLSGRASFHVVAHYELKNEDYTEEAIVSASSKPGISYILRFKAPAGRFKALQSKFQDISLSWRWINGK